MEERSEELFWELDRVEVEFSRDLSEDRFVTALFERVGAFVDRVTFGSDRFGAFVDRVTFGSDRVPSVFEWVTVLLERVPVVPEERFVIVVFGCVVVP